VTATDDRTYAEVAVALHTWRCQELDRAMASFPKTSDTIFLSEDARLAAYDAMQAVSRFTGLPIGVSDPLADALWGMTKRAYFQGRVDFALSIPGTAYEWDTLRGDKVSEAERLDAGARERLARCFLRLVRLARGKAEHNDKAMRRRAERTNDLLKEAVDSFFTILGVLEPTGLPILFRPFVDKLEAAGEEFDRLLLALRAEADDESEGA